MKLKSLFVGALLAAFGLTVHAADQEKMSAPAVKAIDMEHHFFLPEFIDYLKTRKEYPIWKDGLGVFYRKGALFPVNRPSSAFGITYLKKLKCICSVAFETRG